MYEIKSCDFIYQHIEKHHMNIDDASIHQYDVSRG